MTHHVTNKVQEEKIFNFVWIYEGRFRKLRPGVISSVGMGVCCCRTGKMWFELTVSVARLDDMMNMQATGYWFGNAFGKQPRGKQ